MKLFRLIEFDQFKGFITKKSSCVIDNFVCQLHYKGTVLILLGFCLLVTARQFFGDPIDCVVKDQEEAFERVINRYCWIHTTFSVESAWRKPVGLEVPYPGVDKATPNEVVTYHAYYQWVWFVLLLQTILFYIPHFIWVRYEGKTTKRLMYGLNRPILDRTERINRISMLSDYLYQTTYHHTCWFFIYVATEVLNLLNVTLQTLLVNRFLGGKFLDYGMQVLGFSGWTQFPLQYDPMMQLFPRMTKCTFHQFGPSGDIQKHDTMCVLPINIVNEKTYLFLWFWFVFLVTVSTLSVVYRILTIICPYIRVSILKANCKCTRSDIHQVLKCSGIGDWFVLCLLATNMDKSNFVDLIADLKLRQEKEKIL